jgi:hypothetical protein
MCSWLEAWPKPPATYHRSKYPTVSRKRWISQNPESDNKDQLTVPSFGLLEVVQPREEPTENTVHLLMWVACYRVFDCSGTVRLMPDHVATPLPTALLLLCVVTADVTCSSVVCAISFTLTSCLLCRNPVTVLAVLQYYITYVFVI